jgi:hypothetical protein
MRGTAVAEWLEGERFLVLRAHTDHPDIPDATSILGDMESDRVGADGAVIASKLSLHYYDSRGVFRTFRTSIDDQAWKFWNDSPGFAQRFTGTFADGGATINGLCQLCKDGVYWHDDLRITYRRAR